MNCYICGNEFEPKNNQAKYCSTECRNKGKTATTKALRDKRAKERIIGSLVCIECGMLFIPNKYTPYQQFCSIACQRRARLKRDTGSGKEQRRKREYRSKNRDKLKEVHRQYHNRKLYNGMREVVLARDGYKCTRCGSKEKIEVHHKDKTGYSTTKDLELVNNNPDNLVTLCKSCHRFYHGEKPSNFKNISKERILEAIAKTNSYTEAYEYLGISSHAFYRKLRLYEIPFKHPNLTKETIEDALRGRSTYEAAKLLGIARSVLLAKRKAYGLPLR